MIEGLTKDVEMVVFSFLGVEDYVVTCWRLGVPVSDAVVYRIPLRTE